MAGGVRNYEEARKLFMVKHLIDRGHWHKGWYRPANCQTWGGCLLTLWMVASGHKPDEASRLQDSEEARECARVLGVGTPRGVISLNDSNGVELVRERVREALRRAENGELAA